jgi:hypothetical protein
MSFDEDVARSYDEGLRGDEKAAVAFLKDAAGGGPALELAIGTGRIAVSPGYLHRLRDSQYVDAEEIRVDKVWLDVARHDPAAQRLMKNHVSFTTAGIALNPVVLRYAWPSELDLMARIAGLQLGGRWGGWERQPFDATSRLHVSVWSR